MHANCKNNHLIFMRSHVIKDSGSAKVTLLGASGGKTVTMKADVTGVGKWIQAH